MTVTRATKDDWSLFSDAPCCPCESPLQVRESRQQFIRTPNKPARVLALCGGNPKLSPLVIRARDTTAIPSGFAQIVSDDFAISHRALVTDCCSRPFAVRICSLQAVRSFSVALLKVRRFASADERWSLLAAHSCGVLLETR